MNSSFSLDQGYTWMDAETTLGLGDLEQGHSLSVMIRGTLSQTESNSVSSSVTAEFDGHELDQSNNTGNETWNLNNTVAAGDGSGCFILSSLKG